MTGTYTNLSQFFGTQNLDQSTIERVKAQKSFQDVQNQIARAVKFTIPDSFYDLLIKSLNDLLNIHFSGLIVRGWQKHRRLKKYLDRQKYPPEKIYSEILLKHTLKSTHKPAIRPVINGVTYRGIEFEVTLELKFETAILQIQDAHIRRIETGTFQGKGEVAYKGFAILRASTQPIKLPGGEDLGNEYPITDLV
jgi:hypothetical protein